MSDVIFCRSSFQPLDRRKSQPPSMHAIGCGYEDADELDFCASDPAFKLACSRLPETAALLSQPDWRTFTPPSGAFSAAADIGEALGAVVAPDRQPDLAIAALTPTAARGRWSPAARRIRPGSRARRPPRALSPQRNRRGAPRTATPP